MRDYAELVKALRYCGSPVTNEYDCNNCPWLKECKEGTGTNPLLKAADLIESLQAQVPKHGEWVLSKDFPGYAMCSCCEDAFIDPEWIAKDKKWNYCPNCGAKMEVSEDG